MKHNVLIAGLGLIGGSLAKAIAQTNDHHLIGYDHHVDTIDYALENKIIDESFSSFSAAVEQADIVILATPISETIRLIHILDEIQLNHDIIVTDVSSVKSSIMDAANTIKHERITFIGGHPMAGSHKTGIKAAKAHLFENAIYVLTPMSSHSNKDVATLKQVLKETKSRFVILQPDEHDEMTSVFSHFHHLIASSLVHQAKRWEDTHAYLPELAAGGFRDITRIASSNPKMWQDIFYHNGYKMAHLLDEWIKEMEYVKEVLEAKDKKPMITYLEQAKTYRDGLDHSRQGAIPAFYDLYIDIKDQPGALALVVQLLASKEISITNIRILEIRDGINGALRVSVPTKGAQITSYELLQKHGYEVMIEY